MVDEQDKVKYAVSEKEDGVRGETILKMMMGCTGLPGCTGLYWVVLGCTGLHWAVLGCTRVYWAELGCTGLYWAELGCSGLGRWSRWLG